LFPRQVSLAQLPSYTTRRLSSRPGPPGHVDADMARPVPTARYHSDRHPLMHMVLCSSSGQVSGFVAGFGAPVVSPDTVV
jgi:hypothetical protein